MRPALCVLMSFLHLLACCRGCVDAGTVAWVRQEAERLPRVPSLAFIHIPIPQFTTAWNRGPVNGTRGEAAGCPGMDTGFFEVARWGLLLLPVKRRCVLAMCLLHFDSRGVAPSTLKCPACLDCRREFGINAIYSGHDHYK